jgi:anti-sigma-K factor RskA
VKSVKPQLAEKTKEGAAKPEILSSLSEAELKEQAEKERKQRQANQEKVAEELRKASEAAAIAAVSSICIGFHIELPYTYLPHEG